MTDQELGTKCQTVMLEHLEALGHPNLTRQQMVNELKPMWLKLETLGLTEELNKRGLTYKRFVDIALNKAQEAAIMEHLSGFARANPRKV